MIVREALEGDFSSILEMAALFWATLKYDEDFDSEHVALMVNMCFEHNLLAVLDDGEQLQGFVAGLYHPLLGSPLALSGSEVAWWVNPEHRKSKSGLELLVFIEGLAKKQDIKYWSMVAVEHSKPEIAERIYKSMGYTKNETMYIKRLK